MIVCPVCENQQGQGDTCDVCGKRLVLAGAVAVAVTPMAELEETRLETAGAVAVSVLPELEQTAQLKGADLPDQSVPELERTVLPGGPDAPVERVPDLDMGRELDDGQRTVLPVGAITCRYCRNVQAAGVICDTCGMRLPTVSPPPVAGAPPGPDAEIWGTCEKCGSRAMVGRRCGSCGIIMTMPSA